MCCDCFYFKSLYRATACKTVRPELSVHCLSVLSVCSVGVFLWPNGDMDQDETWHEGRPRPRPHCVRWGPISPFFFFWGGEMGLHQPPLFGPCIGDKRQEWIKMPLGTEVGRGPGYIMLDGDPAPPPPKRGTAPNFRPRSVVAKRQD